MDMDMKQASGCEPDACFRLSTNPRGVGGPQPSDCKSETSDMHCGPKPTTGRLWASALRERYRAVLTPRFTAFTLPVVSEAYEVSIPIAVCRPGSRRLLGKRCKSR